MLDFSRVQNYYIACGYTDMRKQIDGLAALVQTQFGQEMDETSLYLFCGRRADRIKALYWDGTGYILLYKRLTEKRFQWPRSEKDLKKLTLQEFRWLMDPLPRGKRLLRESPEPSAEKVNDSLKKVRKTKRILPPACRINQA